MFNAIECDVPPARARLPIKLCNPAYAAQPARPAPERVCVRFGVVQCGEEWVGLIKTDVCTEVPRRNAGLEVNPELRGQSLDDIGAAAGRFERGHVLASGAVNDTKQERCYL